MTKLVNLITRITMCIEYTNLNPFNQKKKQEIKKIKNLLLNWQLFSTKNMKEIILSNITQFSNNV